MVNSNFRRNTWVPITNVTKSCAGVIHTNNASETGMCPSKMMLPGDVGGGSLAATSYSQVATALSVPWINSGVFERTLKSCRQSRRIAPKSRLRNSKRLGIGLCRWRYSSQNWRRDCVPDSIHFPKSQRECAGRHMFAFRKKCKQYERFSLAMAYASVRRLQSRIQK